MSSQLRTRSELGVRAAIEQSEPRGVPGRQAKGAPIPRLEVLRRGRRADAAAAPAEPPP